MKSIALALALAAAALALPVAAQEPSPEGTPTLAVEFRAGLADYVAAIAAGPNTQTVADMSANFEANLAHTEAEFARVQATVPEPCYSDAHAAYIDYLRYVMDVTRETLLPALEGANTVFDLLAVTAELEARFPAFYLQPDPDATPEPGVMQFGSGAVFQYTLAFDTLNTCEVAG